MGTLLVKNIGMAAYILMTQGMETLVSRTEEGYLIETSKSLVEHKIGYSSGLIIRDMFIRDLLSYIGTSFVPDNAKTNDVIWTTKLGFAAFLRTRGVKLVGYCEKKFYFLSSDMNYWIDQYENSPEQLHDKTVNQIRLM